MITHPYDDIAAYALGTLDQTHAQAVLEHADGCPTCAVLMADAMVAMHGVLGAQPERPLPARHLLQRRFKPDILHGPSRTRPRFLHERLLPWSIAGAALAACIGLLFWSAQLRTHVLQVPVAALVHSHFTHHPLHGGVGSAKVIQALNGQWLYVVADGLRPRTSYTLSEVIGGHKRTVGTFSSDDAGNAAAFWQQPPAQIASVSVIPTQSHSSEDELRWP